MSSPPGEESGDSGSGNPEPGRRERAPRERGDANPALLLAQPPSRWSDAAFWPFWAGFGGAMRLWFRLRAENRPPLGGSYVLAANHVSYLDPLLLGAVVPRRIVYMMTVTVWRSRTMGWFYRWNRTIPLAVRTANRDAMRAARSVLQQGRLLGIFPEGGLSRDGGLLLGNPGAVALVLQEGVPIVPVGIVGAERALPVGAWWPRPCQITIRFGQPITADELSALSQDRRIRLQLATKKIMAAIAELVGKDTRERELERLRPVPR